ncbi:hypothetical protein L13192_03500 [Pyrenophora tritici-repentis]|nr:hypothetical protein L13192_03500 [Pyrenophora tritici-repentis]
MAFAQHFAPFPSDTLASQLNRNWVEMVDAFDVTDSRLRSAGISGVFVAPESRLSSPEVRW